MNRMDASASSFTASKFMWFAQMPRPSSLVGWVALTVLFVGEWTAKMALGFYGLMFVLIAFVKTTGFFCDDPTCSQGTFSYLWLFFVPVVGLFLLNYLIYFACKLFLGGKYLTSSLLSMVVVGIVVARLMIGS